MLNYLKTFSKCQDFPGGPVVKNPPASTGDVGWIPGRGTKIPHALGQLRPRTTTTEPTCPGARMPQLERSPQATAKSPCHNKRSRMPQLRPKKKKKNI